MLLIGAVFGLLAGTLIEEFNMQPFIATLSTMFLARGLASIISTDSLTFPQGNDFSFISNVIKIIDKSEDLQRSVLQRRRDHRTGGCGLRLRLPAPYPHRTHHLRHRRLPFLRGTHGSAGQAHAVHHLLDLCDSRRPGLDRVHCKHRLCKNTVVLAGSSTPLLRGHRRYDHHRWLRYVLGSVLGSLVRSILDPLTSDFGVPAEWTPSLSVS